MILLQWVTLVQLRRFGEVVSAFFDFFLLIRFIHLRVRETKTKILTTSLAPHSMSQQSMLFTLFLVDSVVTQEWDELYVELLLTTKTIR